MSRRLHILPDGLKWGDISREPTWEEKALDWHRQQIALALAAVKRIELQEQRLWLVAATQRAVAAGLLIDETDRKLALQEEMVRTEKVVGRHGGAREVTDRSTDGPFSISPRQKPVCENESACREGR